VRGYRYYEAYLILNECFLLVGERSKELAQLKMCIITEIDFDKANIVPHLVWHHQGWFTTHL
jgi:hypothetical protein